MRMPPLKGVWYFKVVASHLSFKLAGEELHVTQAAVSQQIKQLEEFLEQKLFVRKSREIELTEAGAQFLPFVVQGFDAFAQGLAQLKMDNDPDQLVISSIPSFTARWLMPNIYRFLKRFPNMNIRFDPNVHTCDFKTQNIDIALRYGRGRYPGLKAHLVMRDYIYPVCQPQLYEDNPSVKELLQLPLFRDHSPDAYQWQRYFEEAGIDVGKVKCRFDVNDSSLMVEGILAGQGMGLARHSLVYKQVKSGQLVRPFDYVHHSKYAYYVVAPEHHFGRQKVKDFIDWFEQAIEADGLLDVSYLNLEGE